jgi:hypothetical protein
MEAKSDCAKRIAIKVAKTLWLPRPFCITARMNRTGGFVAAIAVINDLANGKTCRSLDFCRLGGQ